jgi:hypothetical protein
MSITIGNYAFEGPFGDPASLKNQSGVYAVLTRSTSNDSYTIVDVGEAGAVRDRITNHDRQDCWKRNKKAAGLSYAAYYCDERTRMSVEKMLRAKYNPPCGDR